MRKTIFFILLITSACAFVPQMVFAQNGISLSAEIQNMEKAANKQGTPPAQRHETLVRLARLKQLSGDIEGAAKNWLEAAAAIPGKVDDDALLACAGCLAAMGEWDRASTALEPIVSKIQRARFLDVSIKAIKSGDVSALAALAVNPQFSQMKSEIYFMLWKVSKGQTAEGWRGKLLAEYPQSPEGRLAAGESSSTFTVKPSPFWFFASGLDSLPLSAETYTVVKPTSSINTAPQSIMPQNPAPQQTAAPSASAPVQEGSLRASRSVEVPVVGTKLQIGLYSRQDNADKQMEKLRVAGFTPFMEKRNENWVVIVPSGPDQGRTIRELRDAGFESFPVK